MTEKPLLAASLPRLRSLLFAPASRPDMCAKLPRIGPDGAVLDPGGRGGSRGQSRGPGPGPSFNR